jgi:hypothetical protein
MFDPSADLPDETLIDSVRFPTRIFNAFIRGNTYLGQNPASKQRNAKESSGPRHGLGKVASGQAVSDQERLLVPMERPSWRQRSFASSCKRALGPRRILILNQLLGR